MNLSQTEEFKTKAVIMKKLLSTTITIVLLISIVLVNIFTLNASAKDNVADTYNGFNYIISNDEITITSYDNWQASLDLVIPDNINGYPVTGLGGRAFGYHWNIKSIYIPKSITDIDTNNTPFYFCSSIESIIVEEGNPKYRSQSNCLIDIESEKLLLGCKNSIIPSDGSVTKIGGMYAFSGRTFTSFVIPDKVEVIELGAFNACYQLKEIVLSEGVKTIGSHPFRLTAIEKIVLPKSVQSIGDMVFADTPIKDIYYVGSETDRELITIDSDNSELFSATWHYNTCKPSEHTYTNNLDATCENCEWIRWVYKSGDINADGAINNKDLGLLMQYLNDWGVEINTDAADVNGNGSINNKDYGLLMQYLNGWDIELK